MSKIDPYICCPTYETKSFIIRLLSKNDAADLLKCYSDPVSAKYFNKDNCHHDFICHSIDEMQEYVHYWLKEYDDHGFVRFSIVDKSSSKAVGTIEMFVKFETIGQYSKVGVLRLDLESDYEYEDYISEIINVANGHFYEDFDANYIITKAIPIDSQRVSTLLNNGYKAIEDNTLLPFDDYFIR